jgi:hypothetical protein
MRRCPASPFSTKFELTDVLPEGAGKCWFIPETEPKPRPVYLIELAHLPALLNDCPYFEYYVVATDFDWLVSESDHNVYFVCEKSGTEGAV